MKYGAGEQLERVPKLRYRMGSLVEKENGRAWLLFVSDKPFSFCVASVAILLTEPGEFSFYCAVLT